MKNYRKHIDDFFREKLGRYKETPPDDVWDSLSGKLDTLKPFVPKSPFRWVWHFGMVSLIAVLGVSLTRKLINKPAEPTTQTEVAVTPTVTPTTEAQQSQSAAAAEQNAAEQSTAATTNEQNASTATTPVAQANGSSPVATNAQGNNVANNSQQANARHYIAAVKRDANGGAEHNTARIKERTTQHQSAYAAAKGPNATTTMKQHNSIGTNKNGSSKKKIEEFFSGNQSIAQLSSTMSSVTENNAAEQLPTEATPSETKTQPTAPVKNINKDPITEFKKKTAEKIAEKKADKPAVKRFDFGVKAGYEQGFTSPSATKWVVAPYMQYRVAPKMSLMLQPGIKYATLSQRNAGKTQTFYSVNQDGKVAQYGSTVIDSIKVLATNVDTYYHTNYRYTQSHDSIVKTRTIGGSYVEFELPILLQYAVSKQMSVYGGVNLLYSKRLVVTENTYTKTGIQRTMDTTVYGTGTPSGQAAPQMNGFTYTGNPYSDYQNPGVYPMKQENILRVGYMLGLTYEYSNRWLFDALIQHSPLKPNVKDGYNLNSSLSSPYFRLSVGYKLTK